MTSQARSFYFGEAGGECFGWLHEPLNGPLSRMGMVVCNSFGNECDATYRSLRSIASMAAENGVATLRFDYHGCGDSAGDLAENNHPSAWLHSFHEAIDALRKYTHVEQICVLGIRLGALIAGVIASERDDVCGYVALAPVTSGKAFLREALLRNAQDPGGGEADLELAGYALSCRAQAELRAIDLLSMRPSQNADVLIVNPDNRRETQRWIAHLQKCGAHVDLETSYDLRPVIEGNGLENMSQAITGRVAAWVGTRGAALGFLPPEWSAPSQVVPELNLPGIRETPLPLLVDDLHVFSILSEPKLLPVQQVCVLLNTGGGPRTGPSRMHVTWARSWARGGIAVLRLDLPGLGDSDSPSGYIEGELFALNADQAISTAVRWVRERYGNNLPCHLIGICNGAYHAFRAAVDGVPVQSLILINQVVYFWKSGRRLKDPQLIWYLAYVLSGLGHQTVVSSVKSAVIWILQRFKRTGLQAWFWLLNAARDLLRSSGISTPGDLAGNLLALMKRKVKIHMLFAEHDFTLQVLHLQGGRTIAALHQQGKIDLRLIQGANRAFTSQMARANLQAELDQIILSKQLPGSDQH